MCLTVSLWLTSPRGEHHWRKQVPHGIVEVAEGLVELSRAHRTRAEQPFRLKVHRKPTDGASSPGPTIAQSKSSSSTHPPGVTTAASRSSASLSPNQESVCVPEWPAWSRRGSESSRSAWPSPRDPRGVGEPRLFGLVASERGPRRT